MVGWSLRSRNSRGVDTELRFKTRRLPLLVSPLLFSRSATTPSGTRDSAQADQQKRASPCLHLHSRERPSMSLQSMTTLSSSLVSPKGRDDDSGNGGIRFLTLHTHTHTQVYTLPFLLDDLERGWTKVKGIAKLVPLSRFEDTGKRILFDNRNQLEGIKRFRDRESDPRHGGKVAADIHGYKLPEGRKTNAASMPNVASLMHAIPQTALRSWFIWQ